MQWGLKREANVYCCFGLMIQPCLRQTCSVRAWSFATVLHEPQTKPKPSVQGVSCQRLTPKNINPVHACKPITLDPKEDTRKPQPQVPKPEL